MGRQDVIFHVEFHESVVQLAGEVFDGSIRDILIAVAISKPFNHDNGAGVVEFLSLRPRAPPVKALLQGGTPSSPCRHLG